MMKIQLLALLLASAPTCSGMRGKLRIIGGEEAEIGRFSYAVSLHDDIWGHFCGGSLIGRDVVLTAAHCLGYSPFKAIVGRHRLDSDEGKVHQVASRVRHPEYDIDTVSNDIMLVFLEEPADSDVELVRVNPDQSSPEIGTPVTVAGWGLTDENSFDPSEVLRAVNVNTVSNEECNKSEGEMYGLFDNYAGQIIDSMLCAEELGHDSCQGDSGGPLVIENDDGSSPDVQVGITSWGYGCAHEDFPGVYTRVSSYYDWIRKLVCRKSLYPPADFECDDIDLRGETPAPAPLWPPTTIYPTWRWTYSPTEARDPTPKPTSPCEGNTPDWVDGGGDGCSWYEMFDAPGCPSYGESYEGVMGVANDNCCYCAGTGAPVVTPSPSPFPTWDPATTRPPTTNYPTWNWLAWTNYPTAARDPTPKPTSPCTGNTANWTDFYGDGCTWYEMSDYPGCPNFGGLYEGNMGVANDNCCHCEGTGAPVATPSPTPYPTWDPATTWPPVTPYPTWYWTPYPVAPTPKPTSPCEGSTPGWTDSYGDDCSWYETFDSPGCPLMGDDYEGDMGVASDNCCYCAREESRSCGSITEKKECKSARHCEWHTQTKMCVSAEESLPPKDASNEFENVGTSSTATSSTTSPGLFASKSGKK